MYCAPFQEKNLFERFKLLECRVPRAYYSPIEVDIKFKNKK